MQGVSFRDNVQREAEQRDVTGWVRNNSDGSVEALFEGPDAEVDRLVEWMRGGPSQASVEQADVSDADPTGGTRFEVH